MFDIIDLNETEHETKPTEEATIALQENINFKPAKKLTQKGDKIGKEVNKEKQKLISKTDIYKNADPKKQNLNPIKSTVQKKTAGKETLTTPQQIDLLIENEKSDFTKEFPLFPIIKDPSPFLNRTFRKSPVRQKSQFTDIKTLNVQDISNSVQDKIPDMQFESLPTKINVDATLKPETVSFTHIIDIDPKIDILNNNSSVQNNDSEIIEFVAPPEIANKTFEGDQFMEATNKVNLAGTTKSKDTTEEPLENDQTNPDDQPKPNRQRQLTRPQRKTFYPYFFSRVLG